jgi:hypothetical protein
VIAGTADDAVLYNWRDQALRGWLGLGGCLVSDALVLADEETIVASLLVRQGGALTAVEPKLDPRDHAGAPPPDL